MYLFAVFFSLIINICHCFFRANTHTHIHMHKKPSLYQNNAGTFTKRLDNHLLVVIKMERFLPFSLFFFLFFCGENSNPKEKNRCKTLWLPLLKSRSRDKNCWLRKLQKKKIIIRLHFTAKHVNCSKASTSNERDNKNDGKIAAPTQQDSHANTEYKAEKNNPII